MCDICVSVHHEHCIRLFDLNLNQLKQFGSFGAGNNQFNYPAGLCCHGDYVYICDRGNKRIQILTLDFEYSSTIQLDDYPRRVQTSETTIGVSGSNGITFFYDLKTRALNLDIITTEHGISIILIQYFMVRMDMKRNFIFLIPMEILLKRWR